MVLQCLRLRRDLKTKYHLHKCLLLYPSSVNVHSQHCSALHPTVLWLFLSLCLQGSLLDFSKRSRSAKFRLVPKFKKDKNNKNKETCATLSLPGEFLLFPLHPKLFPALSKPFPVESDPCAVVISLPVGDRGGGGVAGLPVSRRV